MSAKKPTTGPSSANSLHAHLHAQLSGTGLLRIGIACAVFFNPASHARAQDLIALPGPDGGAIVHSPHGTPVADIVRPDQDGVSHNLFVQFNVPQQGAVLNNALQAGTSLHAGALQANPQFQGVAADIIITEVVGGSRSHFNGPLEVFGQPADLVALNPSGITINGGSFINTPNVDLVVGSRQHIEGRLQYSTEDARGTLEVGEGGVHNDGGRLALLAPRINTAGELVAQNDLDIILGRNRVDAHSGEILASFPDADPGGEQRIDARLFGAMRAGRIRVISTARGAGVRIGDAPIAGRNGVTIVSAGSLGINGRAVDNQLEVIKASVTSSEGDVLLKSDGDMRLTATDVDGNTVRLQAGKKLTLDSEASKHVADRVNTHSQKKWIVTYETYDNSEDSSSTRNTGSDIAARKDLLLSSGEGLTMEASSAKAARLAVLESGGDMQFAALNDSSSTTNQGKHRKHLWKNSWNNKQYTERSVGSSVEAGEALVLRSDANVGLRGASLNTPGTLSIRAQGEVDVGTAERNEWKNTSDYRGDLVGGAFFGNDAGDQQTQRLNTGSSVTAGGALSIDAADVIVTGSRVLGEGGAKVVSRRGDLTIKPAQDRLVGNEQRHDSKVFGLLASNSTRDIDQQSSVIGQVESLTNLELVSAGDLTIDGSLVDAVGELKASAAGDFNLVASANQTTTTTSRLDRSFFSDAAEQPDTPGQWDANVGYGVKTSDVKETATTHTASGLRGGSVAIEAGGTYTSEGSDVASRSGDIAIKAKDIQQLATEDVTHTVTEETDRSFRGGYTGGMDRSGSFYAYKNQLLTGDNLEKTARVSTLQSAGALLEDVAGGTIVNQGTDISAQGTATFVAGRIDNRAAQNSQVRSESIDSHDIILGAHLDTWDLTRPIEKMINGVEQRKSYDPSLLGAMDSPSLGVSATDQYRDLNTSQQATQSQATRISGAEVDVRVEGQLTDVGTHYTATQGRLTIEADGHDMQAAQDTQREQGDNLKIDASARLFTKTGKDINVRLQGAGGSDSQDNSASTALPGSFSGAGGVSINVTKDAQYAGSHFDGGTGDIEVTSGGALTLAAAQHVQSTLADSLSGYGFGTLNTPTPSASTTGAGISLLGQLDQDHLYGRDTQAVGASLVTDGQVTLKAGGDVLLDGTRIGTAERPVAGVEVATDGKLSYLAGTDTHSAKGDSMGGGLDIGAGKKTGDGNSAVTGTLGLRFAIGRVDESSELRTAPELFSSAPATFAAAAADPEALHLQGVQLNASRVTLETPQGGQLIESATSVESRNNWQLAAGGGGTSGKTSKSSIENPGQVKFDQHARALVHVDKLDSSREQNLQINAPDVVINSADTVVLAGANINADQVTGTLGADLAISSRKDHEASLKIDLDTRLQAKKNAGGLVDNITGLTGPFDTKLGEKAQSGFDRVAGSGEKNKLGQFADKQLFGDKTGTADVSQTLFADVVRVASDHVAQAAGITGKQGVALDVAGSSILEGAKIVSSDGAVNLGEGPVISTDLKSHVYRQEVALNVSTNPVNLIEGLTKELLQERDPQSNALDLGIGRVGGESRVETVKAGVEQAREWTLITPAGKP